MRRLATLLMAFLFAIGSVAVVGCNDSPSDDVEDAAENIGDAAEDATD